MKSTLNRIQKEKDEIQNTIASYTTRDSDDETSISRPRRGHGNILLPKECLFCKKEKRTKSKTREPLALCIDIRAEKSIKSAATKKGDFIILGIPDLIASEAHYHKTCYKQYIKVNYENEKEKNTPSIKEAEKMAYRKIVEFCVKLQLNPDVIPLSFLNNMMENSFAETNDKMSYSAKKNLRRKIENEVDEVKFLNVDGTLYCYPKNITIEHLVEMLVRSRNELQNMKDLYIKDTVDDENLVKSVNLAKKEIKELKDTMPWPPQPTDLVPEKLQIPHTLDLFFTTLLQNEQGILQPKGETLKMSFSQDIIYAVTKG